MSQAEELLNSVSEKIPVHTHPVPDTDTYFIIDPITRQIENTNHKKTVVMQYDHNSERFTFELPRYIDGHDMLECTSVTVNVDNIEVVDANDSESAEPRVNPDAPDMTDLRVHPNDPDKVISSWLITRNSTQLAGILSFHIEYKCVDSSGNVVYEWSTDNYDEIEVRARKKNGEAAVIEHNDLLEQWRARIFGAGDSVMANIAAEGEAQVAAVKAESETQQEAVELKGANTLETIPEDYTEVDTMATEAVRTKADAIVCEAAGKHIVIKDSSDDHIRGLRVFGKTTQVTTTGAQLMPQPYYDSSMVRHGVTFTVNDDGSITMVGTNTAGDSVSCYFMLHSGFSATGIHTYKCYGLPETCVTNIYYRGDAVGDAEILLDLYEPNEYGFVIRVKAGATVNATVYPMLNAGETALPYEPYTGGKPAPNPDYPQDIVGIENPTVNICGKNLADFACFSGSNNYIALVNVSDLRSVKKGQRYTLSVYLHATAATRAYWNNAARLYAYLEFDVVAGTNRYTYSFTALEDGELYEAVSNVVNKYPTSDDVVVTALNAQLEFGDKATEYEPYEGGLLPITTPSILPGIPVTSGGNYTDSDGQQWICDEVDLERGVYVQRVIKKTFSASVNEAWRVYNVHPDKTHTAYQESKLCGDMRVFAGTASDVSAVLSNKYTSVPLTDLYDQGIQGIAVSNVSPAIRMSVDACQGYSIEEFREWLKENPFEVLYPLATPIETPLTAEEIAAFKALRTNCTNTTILNDAGAWMEVKYNADTKTYVENPKILKLTDSSTGVVYELKIVDGNLTVTPV